MATRLLPTLLAEKKCSSPNARLPVQQLALRIFSEHLIPDTWHELLHRRLKNFEAQLCDPIPSKTALRACLDDVFACLRVVDKFVAMCWLKTIANGWTTTHRMHEPIKWSCIFGCTDGLDELSHYLSCPILLSVVRHCFSTPFGPTILHRLCIRSPSPQAAIMITTCFNIYHTLKGGHRGVILEAFRCHRVASIMRLDQDIATDIP